MDEDTIDLPALFKSIKKKNSLQCIRFSFHQTGAEYRYAKVGQIFYENEVSFRYKH